MSTAMRTPTKIATVLLFGTCTWLLLVANVPRLAPAELAAIAGTEDAMQPSCPAPLDGVQRWWFGD